MSITTQIEIMGKYKGIRDVLIIGGVQFKKDKVTHATVNYDMYLKLKKGVSSGWFEIVMPSEGGSQGIQGPKGDPGEQGPKGDTGERGPAGADGKSVELQMSGTKLQWRQTGGEWSDLYDLATLSQA